jgi:Domain of unknown function (DUF4259)
MCVWNYGVFDNDTALDLENDIKKNGLNFFKSSFKHALETDYLEQDEGCAALISAAYLDHYLNGTDYFEEKTCNNMVVKRAHAFQTIKASGLEGVLSSLMHITHITLHPLSPVSSNDTAQKLPTKQLETLITPAIAAINVVLDGQSELSELWQGDELLYPLWREDKLNMINRLQAHLNH